MRDPEPPPIRPPFDPPDFADGEPFGGGGGDGGGPASGDLESDRGLLIVVGVIVALGVLIAALVVLPIPGVDFGGDGESGGVTTEARDTLPPLPAGLTARSELHDIQVGDFEGGATLTVPLSEPPQRPERLAFYTYTGGAWLRLVSVVVVDGGEGAQGTLDTLPANVAVLERTALATSLALLLDLGEAPEPAALRSVSIIAVEAARPLADTDEPGSVELDMGAFDALAEARAETQRYLGVAAHSGAEAEIVDIILATPALVEAHVAQIVAAALAAGADGVHLDYTAVDPARRAPFSSFVGALSVALQAEGLGLTVSVPTPIGGDTGAYDWGALAVVADAVWLRAPRDGSVYYEQVESALVAQREAGLDLSAVVLVVDRRSYERSADGVRAIARRDGLAIASELRARVDAGIAPGDGVTVNGTNIDRAAGNTGLQWDDRSKTVSFAYAGRGGPRTVWLENRFSLAFRLDLARRFELGGVVVEAAQVAEGLPDVWELLQAYVEEGEVRLELPFGPYLDPVWSVTDGIIEGDGTDGLIVWRAPNRTGAYEITLVVSDGVVFIGQQISLQVTLDGDQPEPEPDDNTADAGDGSGGDSGGQAEPTQEPTAEPTARPTEEPTQQPTQEPTQEPTATATEGPPGPGGN